MEDAKKYINDGLIENELKASYERSAKAMKTLILYCASSIFLMIGVAAVLLYLRPDLKLASVVMVVWAIFGQGGVTLFFIKRQKNSKALVEQMNYFVVRDTVCDKFINRLNKNASSSAEKYQSGVKLEKNGELLLTTDEVNELEIGDGFYIVCYTKHPKKVVLFYSANEYEYVGSRERIS